MPILDYDLRIFEPYKNLRIPNNLVIPTTDGIAWQKLTKWRWVYNKLDLALLQGIEAAPVGIYPKKYPVFQKPIYNLWGAANQAYLVKNKSQLNNHPGTFWQEVAVGEHLSVDCVIQNGELVYLVTFEGVGQGAGAFDYWQLCKLPQKQKAYIENFIENNFKDFSGCLNIEIIGLTIIEVHLRMGDIDKLFDVELMQNIIDVYQGKPFNFDYQYNYGLYLLPVWIKPENRFNIDEDKLKVMLGQATFYMIDDEESYELCRPGFSRYLIFGTESLSQGKKIRDKICRYLRENKI